MSSDAADAHLDLVRLRFIEAMERRAAGYGGDVRRLLDERIAVLRAQAGRSVVLTGAAGRGGDAAPRIDPARGPLADLVAHLADRAPSRPGEAPAESLAYFRRTWSRLSAERRLRRSLATVPDNAGPLNSHQLVHRALQSMRETSPGYLDHFMTYVDALLWVDQASGGSGGSGAGAAAGGAAPVRAKPVKSAKGVKGAKGAKTAVRGKPG